MVCIRFFFTGQIVILGVLMFSTGQSWACSCSGQSSPTQALANSVAVFKGYVVEISLGSRWVSASVPRPDDCELRIGGEGEGLDLCLEDHVIVTFEVTATWKGVELGRVQVQTPAQGTACGYPFRIGQSYLVYASRPRTDAAMGTTSCHSTKLRSEAQTDLKELGPPIRDKFSEQAVGESSGK